MPGFLRGHDDIDVSSAAGLAVRYVLSNPDVHVTISGMGSRQMVDENIAAAEAGPLSENEREALSALLEKTKGLAELYCTGCGYCKPCPQGVDIPARFDAMNCHKVYGLEEHARKQYGRIRKREAKADGQGICTECGACLEKCPQNLDVITQLKETDRALAVPVPAEG